jgi:hypothetical protein
VINQVAFALGFVDKIVSGSNLAKGFVEGFTKSGGKAGIGAIFRNLGSLFLKALGAVFSAAPLETAILGAVTFGLPILSAALTEFISHSFVSGARKLRRRKGKGLNTPEAPRSYTDTYLNKPSPAAGAIDDLAEASTLAGGKLLRVAGIAGAVVATLVWFEGAGSAVRQFGTALSEMGASIYSTSESLRMAIASVSGSSDDLSGDFDLITAALLPLIAPLQLIELTVLGLTEAFANVTLGFYKFSHWLTTDSWLRGIYTDEQREWGRKRVEDQEAEVAGSNRRTNDARTRHNILWTGARYGGTEGYRSEVAEDITSKIAKLKTLTKGTEEYKKVNDDLYHLKVLYSKFPNSGALGATPFPGAPTTGAPTSPFSALPPAPSKEAVETATATKATATASAKTVTPITQINSQSKTSNTLLSQIKSALFTISTTAKDLGAKFTTPGGAPGGGKGGESVYGSIASGYGLSMTSGYRPGDPGYHGLNRARDYSNGSGPTPQMLGFAQFMNSAYGQNLKELIYTPLGYSIKNGRQVPPYAQGQHYNHVHVAYGLGYPTAFSSLQGARQFEKAVTPGSVSIASVTGRSDEGFGSSTNITNNFEIHQAHGQNADELASIVVQKIQYAVQGLANSYYS